MWSQVDLTRRCAWIHADQAKARKAIAVPLSAAAVIVLREQMGKHPEVVFTYRGKPIRQVNTKAWRSALKAAGIDSADPFPLATHTPTHTEHTQTHGPIMERSRNALLAGMPAGAPARLIWVKVRTAGPPHNRSTPTAWERAP